MKPFARSFLLFVFIFVLVITSSNGFPASPPRMRPYTGIGVVIFSRHDSVLTHELEMPMYEEPGLSRVGMLNGSQLSGNECIFGVLEDAPLVVSARKGDWLQVFYDDAGRKAWIEPKYQGRFLQWEQFLRLHTGFMLPGLQSTFYQLQKRPDGEIIDTVTPNQVFKVLKLENDWGLVLTDQSQIGWLKWRDGDGRLTMGIGK